MSNECKLCGREVADDLFIDEYEICYFCSSELSALVELMPGKLAEYQEAANNSSDPDEKVKYLSLMLNLLYEYKIKYYDNDVDVIEQNVDDLIGQVIDVISYART